jgi:transcriptional pleiotropic regulator of transition state genes
MEATGIVRKLDELGRVVLPIDLRRTYGIVKRDSLEIYVDGEHIILKKYEPACVFCGETDKVKEHKGKDVCYKCRQKLKGISELMSHRE